MQPETKPFHESASHISHIPAACHNRFNRKRLDVEEFEERYGFLYSDYKPSYYFWDSIVMLRKLAIVAIVVFMGNGRKNEIYQVPVALGVIIVSTNLQVR